MVYSCTLFTFFRHLQRSSLRILNSICIHSMSIFPSYSLFHCYCHCSHLIWPDIMADTLEQHESPIAVEFPALVATLKEKYELTKQNADYISSTVDYLNVFKRNIRNIFAHCKVQFFSVLTYSVLYLISCFSFSFHLHPASIFKPTTATTIFKTNEHTHTHTNWNAHRKSKANQILIT